MAKYNKTLVSELCDLLSTGKYTIADSCKIVGLSETQFYKWKKDKADFAEAIKKAESSRLVSFKEMATSGLAKLLDVHEYEEVSTEYENDKEGKPVIKRQKRVKKKIMPNPTAVIFTLTNLDSENWKNRQQTDLTNKGDKFDGGSPFMSVIMNASKKKKEG
ncbi:helix-turn-helix domain-containing protein [Sphingobacterium sp. UBA6320]|uniref:helix-turn-helix domain-containing protein n=1 Tax=Sphingobacterium sp. UBA6320 TaxID=1947510 RepID=UPI0025E5EC9E|nr:helix-turn-helix domain-containing protein [Sphingobacterium sp. UBA6320]